MLSLLQTYYWTRRHEVHLIRRPPLALGVFCVLQMHNLSGGKGVLDRRRSGVVSRVWKGLIENELLVKVASSQPAYQSYFMLIDSLNYKNMLINLSEILF